MSPEGVYSAVSGGEKQAYGAMLAVRATLVMGASAALAKALTSECHKLFIFFLRFTYFFLSSPHFLPPISFVHYISNILQSQLGLQSTRAVVVGLLCANQSSAPVR